ncbi:MAG: hypothetical protein Q8P91_00780 [bacterium]|nr:hypothetical protein [bacterium]
MKLPNFLQPYLASYDIKKLDGKAVGVKKEVISQVLNLGDKKSVKWIFNNYKREDIRKVVSNPNRGSWFAESLNYWRMVLGMRSGSLDENALYKNP